VRRGRAALAHLQEPAHLGQLGVAALLTLGARAHDVAQRRHDARLHLDVALEVEQLQRRAVEVSEGPEHLLERGGVDELGKGDRPVQGRRRGHGVG
jgi:hypothetical protein